MELTDVEVRTKRLLRTLAKLENFELTDLVAKPLRRPRNIAVHLYLNQRIVRGAALAEVCRSLFATPAVCMDAGVDH